MDNSLLNVRDVAKLLNCSPSTVWRLVKSKDLATVRFGGAVRFEVEALRQYVESHRERQGN